MIITEKKNIYDEPELIDILVRFRRDNRIRYDYNLYKIYYDNIFIGSLIEYNIPIKNCLYFDLYVFKRVRRKGFGTKILNIYKNKNKNKDLFVRSNQESKNEFLKKNGFMLIEDNINKNLYYFDNNEK